jgi:hypothetical protein
MEDLFKIETSQILKQDRPFLELSDEDLGRTYKMSNTRFSSGVFDAICGEHAADIEFLFKRDITIEYALRN